MGLSYAYYNVLFVHFDLQRLDVNQLGIDRISDRIADLELKGLILVFDFAYDQAVLSKRFQEVKLSKEL